MRERLLSQLQRFVQCRHKGAQVTCSTFSDVMRYPHSASLLYWGKFSLLRFHGPGVMYWPNGVVAFNGTWAHGRMHGHGSLHDSYGNLVWAGSFQLGQPLFTFGSLWHNYYGTR